MVQQEGPQSRVGAEAHLGSPEFNIHDIPTPTAAVRRRSHQASRSNQCAGFGEECHSLIAFKLYSSEVVTLISPRVHPGVISAMDPLIRNAGWV